MKSRFPACDCFFPAQLRALTALLFVMAIVLLPTGCTTVRQNPAAIMAQHAEDFQTGAPGPKNLWDQVVASVNSNDYSTALSTLEQMKEGGELTPGQMEAVKQTEAALKQQMGAPGTPR
jgi:hypothetical protein